MFTGARQRSVIMYNVGAWGKEVAVVPMREIEELTRRMVEKFSPLRVILFGSHADGTPRDDSDVDLLAIMDFEGSSARESAAILKELSPSFPVELLVRRPEDIERRLAMNDFFLREITDKGKTLYEAAHV